MSDASHPTPSAAWAAVRRLSARVSSSYARTVWNDRVSPARATRCGAIPVSSVPSSHQRPASAGLKPLTQSMLVLLPDPFGPISPTISPCATA